MTDRKETDGLGNTYKLVYIMYTTGWRDIKDKFKELFNLHYGNYEGQVLSSSTLHTKGDCVHSFDKHKKYMVTSHKVKIFSRENRTEFWKVIGPVRNIFDHMEEEKERKELLNKLVGGLTIEQLRRAKIKID